MWFGMSARQARVLALLRSMKQGVNAALTVAPLFSAPRAFSVTEREAGAEQVVGIGELAAAASPEKQTPAS